MGRLSSTTQPAWQIAHRGYSSDYPENTMAAFDAAVAEPVQAIELDVQLSKDGVPLVHHDLSLHRIGASIKSLRSFSVAKLKSFDCGSWHHSRFEKERMPHLDEVLAAYGQKVELLLELKPYSRQKKNARLRHMMDTTLECVRSFGLRERVYILCFNLELLRYGHRQEPGFRYVLNQNEPEFLAREDFLFGYSANIKQLDKSFVERVQNAGKPVLTFTCVNEEHLQRAVDCGVNGIMANDLVWMRETLAHIEMRSASAPQ